MSTHAHAPRRSAPRLTVALGATFALVLGLFGATPPPAAATQLAAGDTQRSGSAFAVGRNDFGQTNPGLTSSPSLNFAALPAGAGGSLTDAVSVAAGNGFVVWVDRLGKVWSLGDNTNGKRGNGTTGGVDRSPVQATGFGGSYPTKAVKVAAFGYSVILLDSNQDVYQWGQVVNSNSTLSIQSTPNKLTFPNTAKIVDISAGDVFGLAVDTQQRVYSWGKNDHGQLGLGTTNTSPAPAQIPYGTKTGQINYTGGTVSLEAGRDFSVYAVTAPGGGVTVWTWGRNDLNQLGRSASGDQRSPGKVNSTAYAGNLSSLSAGTSHALLLVGSSVRWWGTQALSSGSLVAATPTDVPTRSGAPAPKPLSVSAGDSDSFVSYDDGVVTAWGKGALGQLGSLTTADVTTPMPITAPDTPVHESGVPVAMVSRSGETYALVNTDITTSPDMTGVAVNFGQVAWSPAATLSKTFTFTNSSTQALGGLAVSVLADKNAPGSSTTFSATSTTCPSSTTLAQGASCSVTVRFAPTSDASSTAYVVLSSGNPPSGLRSVIKVIGKGYLSQVGLTGYSGPSVTGPSTVGGPGSLINLLDLKPSLIPDALPPTPASAGLAKLPLAELGLAKLPVAPAPLTPIGLAKLPPSQIGLAKLGLAKLGLAKLPLADVGLAKLGLAKLGLAKLPLDRLGGWEALLQAYPSLAKIPVSDLTVGDLVDPSLNQPSDPSVGLPLERVALGDIDLRNSALANVSLLAVLQGAMRLDQYPVDWCTELPRVPQGGACTDGAGLQRSLFELSLTNGMDISLTSVGNVTVGQLVTDSASTTTSPIDDTAWGGILLASTTLSGTDVGDISLSTIPDLSKVLDCTKTSCGSTAGRHLGDADVVSALRPDAVFKDLGSALNPLKIMQLVEPFLDRSSFDWESLPTSAIPLAAYPNRELVTASANVNCDHAAGMSFGFTLPQGFVYIPGTATLDTSSTTSIELSDPTNPPTDNPDRGLVLNVPGLSRTSGPLPCVNDGFAVTVHLKVLPFQTAVGSGYKISGDVKTNDLGPLTGTQAGPGITVTGINNPPDATPDGPTGAADSLILGHLNAGQTAQYVPFDVPPGKIIEAALSGMDENADPKTDLDLTLYYPKGATAGQALSGSGAPVQVPFGEAQAQDGQAGASASGGALQDIPMLTDRLVAAISATRGSDPEQLSAIARQGDDTRHVLAITGFNGASGDYKVRIRVLDPPSLANCAGVTPLTVGTPASTALYQHTGDPAGFPATDTTVVLVNSSRQQAYYGNSSGVLEAAYAFAHTNGVQGEVLQVDSSAAVRAAYAQWDQHPCDPLYSNAVVRAINDFVLATIGTASIRYVDVLGPHPVIPYAWLEDHTRDGSEREEAGDLAFTGGNPIAMASAMGYYASDDPYGTFQPIAVLGQVIYLPQAVTGRLGESSADIIGQLTSFGTATPVAPAGVADPRTATTEAKSAVVTDYDFLAAGGTRTANSLLLAGYAVDHTLSGSTATWTKQQLINAWLGKSPIPAVASLNMHYDQYRALPAYGAATSSLNDLYTARGDVDPAGSLARRVVFTVGCHSALGIPDLYAASGDDRAHDWAQAYAAKGLAVMIGNLGFGYADSDVVAYSARLQNLFADRMGSEDLGTALVDAKRRYLATLASLSPYDLKSLQEMVLWGIPQYRLPGVAAPGQPAGAPLGPSSAVTDPLTGLPSAALSVGTSANELRFANPDGSAVYSGGSLTPPADNGTPTFVTAAATDPAVADHAPQTVSSNGHPILAAQFTDLPALTDSSNAPLVARSVVPRSLTSLPRYAGTARFAEADTDHELALTTGDQGEFPAALGHVWSVPTATGWLSTFVMTPQQDFLDGTAPGHGLVRLFPRSDWVALYGPAGDAKPDTITHVAATRTATTTRYSVDVTHAVGRQTVSVYVLAQPASGSGTWVRTSLSEDSANPGHWTGETAGLLGEFVVVSTNNGADSAFSTLKGEGWQPLDVGSTGDEFSNFALPDPGPTGWYTSYPTATTTPGWTAYVDGTAVPSTYMFTDGEHLVRLKRPDGTLVVGHLDVRVDTVVPIVTMTVDGQPAAGAPSYPDDGNLHHVGLRSVHPVTFSVTAGPSGYSLVSSGVAPYGSGLQVDSSTIGAPPGGQVLSATATSVAGLVGTASWQYRVVYGSAGFVSPVQSTNTVTSVSAYQYAFRIYDGASPSAEVTTAPAGSTFVASFASDSTCAPPGSTNLPQFSSAGSPSYSGGKWVWNIKAPTAGGCQKLTGRLNDGYTQITTLVQVLL